MIYLLVAVLLVLVVLIIVLAAFLFVQQKQIAVIKALATSSTPSSSAPVSSATESTQTLTPVATEVTEAKAAEPPAFTYARQHSDRRTEIIAVSTYQAHLSMAKPMTALIQKLSGTESVLFLDLTLDRQSAQLLNCPSALDELQSVSPQLAYLALAHVQKIESVLSTYSNQFDQIYILLPSLAHSRTAAVFPHAHAYTLLMEPDGEAHGLAEGFELLSKMITPGQWFLGLTAVNYDQSNPRHEQVVTALTADYNDLFLGAVTQHDASAAHANWSSQFVQRRAEEALSLVA
jgi:hypothetical protein